VIEKEQVVAPKFVERFTTVHVKEGEPVVLNARAVGTPIPRITWQKVITASFGCILFEMNKYEYNLHIVQFTLRIVYLWIDRAYKCNTGLRIQVSWAVVLCC
jgi:Immunoglobulin I-set domain.